MHEVIMIMLLLGCCLLIGYQQRTFGFQSRRFNSRIATALTSQQSTSLRMHGDSTDEEEVERFLAAEYGTTESQWQVTKLVSRQELSTNDCYRAHMVSPATTLFVKCSKQSGSILRYEFEGMQAFMKYTKELIAAPLLYNHEKKYLVTEYLHDYVPLTNYFSFARTAPTAANTAEVRVNTMLEVDLDVYRAMGTVMGRSHARTHRAVLDPAQYTSLQARFRNAESFQLWDEQLFAPTQRILDTIAGPESPSPSTESAVRELLQKYNTYGEDEGTAGTESGPLSEAVNMLRQTYLDKKEALVHADLHSSNVLMYQPNGDDSRRRDRDRPRFKIIDFEKCAMGPAGLDLGIFLANFMWYYAGHSEAGWRRSLAGGVLSVIDSYKQAFRVQITGAGGVASSKELTMDVDRIFEEILTDAMGFMGLYTMFMALHGFTRGTTGRVVENPSAVFEVLSMSDMPELSALDKEGRLDAVRRRQISMSIHALLTYLDITSSGDMDHQKKGIISAKTFSELFAADDKILQRSRDHVTEFWY